MQHRSLPDENSLVDWMRRLNRALGEINVFLAALGIGLAVLNATCFVTLTITAAIRRENLSPRNVQPSISQAWPEWFQLPPTRVMASTKMQTQDPP